MLARSVGWLPNPVILTTVFSVGTLFAGRTSQRSLHSCNLWAVSRWKCPSSCTCSSWHRRNPCEGFPGGFRLCWNPDCWPSELLSGLELVTRLGGGDKYVVGSAKKSLILRGFIPAIDWVPIWFDCGAKLFAGSGFWMTGGLPSSLVLLFLNSILFFKMWFKGTCFIIWGGNPSQKPQFYHGSLFLANKVSNLSKVCGYYLCED